MAKARPAPNPAPLPPLVEEIGFDSLEDIGLGLFGERFDLICPECGGSMRLKHSKHGLFYGCERWREGCKGTHGAHEDGSPLGTPANAATKKARIQAHRIFDRLWKGEKDRRATMTRAQAYAWMQREMNLPRDGAHIGGFDIAQCNSLIALVKKIHPGVQTMWDRLLADEDE